MAYIIDLQKLCKACNIKRATKEVFNNRNSSQGQFCAGCAKRKAIELQQLERRAEA